MQVLWRKDGDLIPNSGNYYRVLKAGSLEFSSVKVDDSGLYTCTADNEAGSVNRTIELSVQGQSGLSLITSLPVDIQH